MTKQVDEKTGVNWMQEAMNDGMVRKLADHFLQRLAELGIDLSQMDHNRTIDPININITIDNLHVGDTFTDNRTIIEESPRLNDSAVGRPSGLFLLEHNYPARFDRDLQSEPIGSRWGYTPPCTPSRNAATNPNYRYNEDHRLVRQPLFDSNGRYIPTMANFNYDVEDWGLAWED